MLERPDGVALVPLEMHVELPDRHVGLPVALEPLLEGMCHLEQSQPLVILYPGAAAQQLLARRRRGVVAAGRVAAGPRENEGRHGLGAVFGGPVGGAGSAGLGHALEGGQEAVPEDGQVRQAVHSVDGLVSLQQLHEAVAPGSVALEQRVPRAHALDQILGEVPLKADTEVFEERREVVHADAPEMVVDGHLGVLGLRLDIQQFVHIHHRRLGRQGPHGLL
mmetsp:Transcript_15219/g.45053  ORF Transcript_15219/g.45053 Transcript_15219/m.45053 type:complete len:221 (+) Transcript_15219:776-1438(+)